MLSPRTPQSFHGPFARRLRPAALYVRRRPVLVHLLRGLCVAGALALWAGLAFADPVAWASAVEQAATHAPLTLEVGGPGASLGPSYRSARLARAADWSGKAGSSTSVQLSRLSFEAEATLEAGPASPSADPATQRSLVEMNNISYRWWFGRGSNSVALGLGAATYRVRPAGDPLGANATAVAGAPLLSVALRHRVSATSLVYLDAASARQLGSDDASEFYGARAGVEWKASRNSTLALEGGKVRLRLYATADSQMSLRLRHGGPMLVYRRTFE